MLLLIHLSSGCRLCNSSLLLLLLMLRDLGLTRLAHLLLLLLLSEQLCVLLWTGGIWDAVSLGLLRIAARRGVHCILHHAVLSHVLPIKLTVPC